MFSIESPYVPALVQFFLVIAVGFCAGAGGYDTRRDSSRVKWAARMLICGASVFFIWYMQIQIKNAEIFGRTMGALVQ